MGEECKGVPAFPVWARSSSDYRDLFNSVAEDELKLGVRYMEDKEGGTPNIPDPELGEMKFTEEAKVKYGIKELPPKNNPLLTTDICTIQQTIHERVERMNQVGLEVFPVQESATYTDRKLDPLNKAQRLWLENVTPILFEGSQSIFGIAALPQAEQTLAWMRKNGSPSSRFHFERMRDSGLPSTRMSNNVPPVQDFPNPEKYERSVPWLPQRATFSMMWPIDFTKEELDYVTQNYPEMDPIRRPYTRVYRVSEKEAKTIEENPMRDGDRPVEWMRRGPQGQFYRVRNMAFDEEMRPHWLRMAKALRENADINVGGDTLDEEFRDFTRTMADCIEHGDFERLLKADLAQYKSDLYLTLFTHEGYWDDGVKYPLVFEVGVKDRSLYAEVAKQAYVFNLLGKRVEQIAREEGLKDYTFEPIDISNVAKTAVFFWPTRTGGFMRAFVRDPGGHDYPKTRYDGVEGHRVVMLMDTLKSWGPIAQSVARELFGDEVAKNVGADDLVRFALWHEVGHSAQIKQGAKTLSGEALGVAMGKWWGALVEPWADATALLAYAQLLEDRKIDADAFRRAVDTDMSYQFVRMRSKEAALSDGMLKEGPHITGAGLYIGWLYQEGVLVKGEDGNWQRDYKKLVPAIDKFFDKLTRFAVRGDQAGFEKFARETVAKFETEEKEVLERKKKTATYVLLNRGELSKR